MSPFTEHERLSPLERYIEIELPAQYKAQVEIFRRKDLLELLIESGEMGIRGIDGKEYPIPSLEQVKAEIRKNKEKYETKIGQGFVKIQLTPFAVPLERLAGILEENILAHQNGKLLNSDGSQITNLNTNQPLYKWSGWIDPTQPEGRRGADVIGTCVYHPTSFEQTNHGGHTKAQILKAQEGLPFAGWNVILTEPNKNIPRKGKGKTIGGRQQIEANRTPNEYLEQLQTDQQYQHEQGLTCEDWLTEFLIHLEETDQVIDDWGGKGSANFLTGSFNPSSDVLGYANWDRDSARAYLNRNDPGYQRSYDGSRSAVGLGEKLVFED